MNLKNIIGDNMVKDNIILFGSILSLNILNYIFHVYVGRTLGPSDYGIFGSLLSLIYLIGIPMNAIQTGITNFVAKFKANNEYGKISYLFTRSLKKMAIYGVLGSVLFFIVSPLIGNFLKIDTINPLIILGFFLIFSFLLPINRGVLQGLEEFNKLGFSYVMEGIVKVVFGVLLLYFGFGLNGAMIAFVLSYALTFVFVFYFLKFLLKKDKVSFKSGGVYFYSLPVLLMLTSLIAFYTVDVLIVKHFLSSVDAGYYAALSLLGKIIFFGSISVSQVMFPKLSASFIKKENPRKILDKSLLFIFLFAFPLIILYFLFPKLIIGLIFGKEYFAISGLLGYFGIIMGIYSLVYILSFYNLARNNLKFIYVLFTFNILEIILLFLFHSSLFDIIWVLMGVVIGLFLSLLVLAKIQNGKNHINYTGI